MEKLVIPTLDLLLLGDSNSGKSCILNTLLSDNSWNEENLSTVGINIKTKIIYIYGKKIKLQIWDTPGNIRFESVTTTYYREAMGIMLVYDTTNEESFDNIKNWMCLINKHATNDVKKMLIGSKCDLKEKREVPTERAKQFAKKYGIKFFETSSRMDINIDEAFYLLARDIYNSREDLKLSQSISTFCRYHHKH